MTGADPLRAAVLTRELPPEVHGGGAGVRVAYLAQEPAAARSAGVPDEERV